MGIEKFRCFIIISRRRCTNERGGYAATHRLTCRHRPKKTNQVSIILFNTHLRENVNVCRSHPILLCTSIIIICCFSPDMNKNFVVISPPLRLFSRYSELFSLILLVLRPSKPKKEAGRGYSSKYCCGGNDDDFLGIAYQKEFTSRETDCARWPIVIVSLHL